MLPNRNVNVRQGKFVTPEPLPLMVVAFTAPASVVAVAVPVTFRPASKDTEPALLFDTTPPVTWPTVIVPLRLLAVSAPEMPAAGTLVRPAPLPVNWPPCKLVTLVPVKFLAVVIISFTDVPFVADTSPFVTLAVTKPLVEGEFVGTNKTPPEMLSTVALVATALVTVFGGRAALGKVPVIWPAGMEVNPDPEPVKVVAATLLKVVESGLPR